MKKPIFVAAALVVSVLIVGGVVFGIIRSKEQAASANVSVTTMRLGWQIPWATQGQLVQVMKNTQIPHNNGLSLDLSGFESGAPLNQAAVGGKVDALFTADQPAITLISKQPTKWQIIGRLMYNRVSVYVPPKSSVESVQDLKGKNVGVPFGTASQMMLILAEQKANLVPGTDVNNDNVSILAQSGLVNDPNAETWGNYAALAGFDPTPAIFVSKGNARYISTDKVVSVVVMSKAFISAHPNAPTELMKSLSDAYSYYRSNEKQANAWYVQNAQLAVPDAVLNDCAAIEPNMNAKNVIRLSFTADDEARMQRTADFLYTNKLIDSSVKVTDYIGVAKIN